MKLILTDCDGVLLNWMHGFERWIDARGYTKNHSSSYNIGECYGIDEEFATNLIRSFNQSAAIGFLPPYLDSIKYVRKLFEEHGYVFRVITSLSKDPYAIKLREQNLSNLFGSAIDSVICLDTLADKRAALSSFANSGMWWIEDKPENARIGTELGLQSILIEHEHNSSLDGFNHAKDWQQVYKIITGEL